MKGEQKKAVIWQSLANYTERGWGFLYSIILARVILPKEFGLYATAMGIAALAAIFTKWEIGNLVRVEKEYQTDEGFSKAWSMTKLLVFTEIGLVFSIGIGLFVYGQVTLACILIIIGACNALDKFPNLLRCDLESRLNFKSNFRVKLIFTPIAAAITIPMGFMGFGVWALVSSAWVGVVVNWLVYRHSNKRVIIKQRFRLVRLERIIKLGVWQWLCYIAAVLYTRVDKLLVGQFGDTSSVGYYNRSYNYAPLSFMVLGAVAGNAAVVQFSNVDDDKEILKLYWKKLRLLLLSGVMMGGLWLGFGEQIVLFLFGEKWLPAVPYFKAFSMFGAVQGIYFLSTSLMQGAKFYKQQGLACLSVIAISLVIGCFTISSGVEFVVAIQCSMILSAMVMLKLRFKKRINYEG